MKTIVLAVATSLIATPAFSQKKIKVEERMEEIGGGRNNTLTVMIYEATPSMVEKEWKSAMKDYKAKVGNQKGEIFADDAVISYLGDNSSDVYARVNDNKDGSVTLIVGYDLGGAFLTSSLHSDRFEAARKDLYEFAVKTTKVAIGDQLSDAEKAQKKMEREQSDLVRDKENLHKDIESYKSKISEAEKAIEENIKAQEKKKAEIEAQKKSVESISGKLKAVQ